MAINQLSISYPNFVLDTVIDPEQFDTNNAEIQTKVNEVVSAVNADITNLANNYYNKTDVDNKDAVLLAAIGQQALSQIPDGTVSTVKLHNDIRYAFIYKVRWF